MARRTVTRRVGLTGITATNITFPAQVVMVMMASAISATVAVYASQATLRSDIRDIKTRMEGEAKAREAEALLLSSRAAADAKLQEERTQSIKVAVDAVQRQQQLQQYEFQALKETVLSMKGGTIKKENVQ